ncbi:MAG: lasso peptide biosynthesis B2 protein [Rhodobacteraceae bacterium]|nr:lasso peptide biosynthesis B2 protein [Paracoccaceae bacterium]
MARKAEIVGSLALAVLLIRFVPLRHWRGLLGELGPGAHEAAPTAREIHRASMLGAQVDAIAGAVPFRAICLPRALACRWMLARRGIPTRLHIGARKGQSWRSHDLHAWLMLGETCVVGASEREDYRHLQ